MTRAAAALVLALTTAAASADDLAAAKYANWHHWRGPDANGSAPKADPPTAWGETTGVKWKVPLLGKGSATPIVWGDRVFVLTAVKTDRAAKPDELPKPDPRFQTKTEPPRHFHQFVVLCFDRTTGKKLWEKVAAERVPHEGHHNTHSYAAGSPTTDGKHLFVSFGSFGLYCYDLDGNPKWSRDLGRLNTRLGWGEAVSPVIHGDNLLVNFDQEADAALYNLDPATGRTKWVAKRDEKSTWTTPLVVVHAGRTQVIVNGTTRIRSHDLATGEVIWSAAGMTVNPIPSPLRFGDSAIVMSGYRGAAAASIPLATTGDLAAGAKVNWRYATGTPYVASPALADGRVYFTQGLEPLLTILDAKTGKPLTDRERLPRVSSFYGSPVVAAGRVYLADQSGTTLVLKAGDSVEVLATNKLDDKFDASPVAVGKHLFLRGEKHLYCIE